MWEVILPLGIDSGQMTSNPEVIGSYGGLVPRNALISINGVSRRLSLALSGNAAAEEWFRRQRSTSLYSPFPPILLIEKASDGPPRPSALTNRGNGVILVHSWCTTQSVANRVQIG